MGHVMLASIVRPQQSYTSRYCNVKIVHRIYECLESGQNKDWEFSVPCQISLQLQSTTILARLELLFTLEKTRLLTFIEMT